jgi:hypothetical protein
VIAMTPLTGIALGFSPLFAARGRLIRGLIEGDPVAWTILVGAVVIMGGWALFKKLNGR